MWKHKKEKKMVNRVVLVGRLVKDPELRVASNGMSFLPFTIAVDNRTKETDGTRGTMFLNCTVFREQADNMVKYTKKGSLIAVDGSLNQRNYVRADGTKGKDIELMVDSVTFLEPKKENESYETPKLSINSVVNQSNNLDDIDLPDDDLPF